MRLATNKHLEPTTPISPRSASERNAVSPVSRPQNKPQKNEFVPLALDLEFARVMHNPLPHGFYLRDINMVKRSCLITFTTLKHGRFEIQVTFPSLYPYNASPSFEFVQSPLPALQSLSINQTKIDMKHRLDEVAAEHVVHDRPCLGACIDALSAWVEEHLGEVVDSDNEHNHRIITHAPLTVPITRAHRAKSTPPRPSSISIPALTIPAPRFASPPKQSKATTAAATQHIPNLPPPPTKIPTGCVLDMHTVTSAETLMGIAIAHDMAPAVLKKLNR